MSSTWFIFVLEIAVISSGLVAGIFLTFSDFVMRSLKLAENTAGVEVMQIINREVYRSVFMVLLWGTLVLSLLLAGFAFLTLSGPAGILITIGGVLYFMGVLVVTMVFNVPMNNSLDVMEYTKSETAAYWKNTYVPRWVFWNYVRAVASGGTAVCFLLAIVFLARGGVA